MRQLAFILLAVGLSWGAYAQKTKKPMSSRFIFAAGGGTYSLQSNGSSSMLPAVELSPMFIAYSKWSDFSLSVNSRPSFGYNFKNDVQPDNFLFTDIPLTAELNIGHGSTKDFYSYLGVVVGAGYGWQIYNGKTQSGGAYTGGFRTWLGPLSTTFRYTYIQTNSFEGINMHRITVAITIGRWVKKVKQMNRISSFIKPVQ